MGAEVVTLEKKRFMGSSQKNWSSDALCVDLSAYSTGTAFPKHGHVDPFFCFVLKGACEEVAGSRHEYLGTGSLVYHPAGFEHSNCWHEDGMCMHIEFASDLVESANIRRLSELHTLSRPVACSIASSIYGELNRVDSVSGIAFEGLTLSLLAATIRESNSETNAPRWLLRIKDRLSEDFIEPLSLRSMAAEAGVHPTYLATSFHRHFGTTIGGYVRAKRVERAKDLLANSEAPLVELAMQLGFADQSHLGRLFKLQTGMTPLQYRRHVKGITKP